MKKPFPPRCCELNLSLDEEQRLITMFQALGNPIRYEILKYLITHPGCITGDIVEVLPIAQSTTSQHLKVLKEAGWITGSLEGTATNYCIAPDALKWFKDTVLVLFGEERK